MRPSLRTARLLWSLVGLAVTVKVLVSPEHHTLWPVFRRGALGWWSGQNIYFGAYAGNQYFSYSPAFAVLLAPLAALGVLGNILFNLGGLALLFHAIRRLARVVFPQAVLSRHEAAVLLMSLIGVLRSVWSSQAHTWSAALIFLAAAALIERRWWAAAFALSLSVHLKLAPIALAGVVAVNWAGTMSWRLPMALGSWALLPLVRDPPERVLGMYREWLERLETSARLRFPSFRDVWHLFEVFGIDPPVLAYRALQGICGLGVLLWTWRLGRRGVEATWMVSGCFALTTAYMLAFGPAVEFTQYSLLAPWISAAWLAAWLRPAERWALGVVFALTMIAGFGAVEDLLARPLGSHITEALITVGTLAFGAWVIRTWRRAPMLPG